MKFLRQDVAASCLLPLFAAISSRLPRAAAVSGPEGSAEGQAQEQPERKEHQAGERDTPLAELLVDYHNNFRLEDDQQREDDGRRRRAGLGPVQDGAPPAATKVQIGTFEAQSGTAKAEI